MSSETSAATRLSPFAFALKPFLRSEKSRLLQRSVWSLGLAAALLLPIVLLLLALHSPIATLLAMAAGFTARYIGQHRLLRTVAKSNRVAKLASFHFDGRGVHCSWDEEELRRYIHSLDLRIPAALAAGTACFLGQRWADGKLQLLPSMLTKSHWLLTSIKASAPWLIVATALFFLWWPGPEKRRGAQVKRATQQRADKAVRAILAPGEIDGLQAGIEVLWQRLGIDRKGEYRDAISKHIGANTTAVVLDPEAGQTVVDVFVGLARQDLGNLSLATARYQEVDCAWKGLQTLASEFRDPLREFRVRELGLEMQQLSRLASDRRWHDLESHVEWMLGELQRLHSELQHHATSVPRVALPPGSDPYRLLGITADTPTPLIKRLRVRLAQLYHPDVSESIANSTKMAELNAAYDAVMKDREKQRR